MFFSKQRMPSTWHHPAVLAIFKSQNFFFWLKNKRSLALLKFFLYLLFFPSNKFWSSYIAWLYIKRTKLHTKGPPLSDPSFWSLRFWNLIHLAAHISKLLHTSPSPFQRYLFLDNTIILHLLHHTITQYPSLPTLHYSEISSFLLPKTHLHLILYFSYKISLLRNQYNP